MFPTSFSNTPWLRPVRLAWLATVVAASSAPAWSVTTLSFTGDVRIGQPSQSLSPTVQQDFWGMTLEPFPSFQIAAGDDVEATVTLINGPYTLPAASPLPGSYRVVRLFFFGDDLAPLDPVGTQGGLELFLQGNSVLLLTGQGCGTSTALAACASWGAPDIGPLTFDSVKFTFHIDRLNGVNPVMVESAYFDTVISTPVPEVSTWALLGVGLAVVGSAARRRRESAAV